MKLGLLSDGQSWGRTKAREHQRGQRELTEGVKGQKEEIRLEK